MSVTTTHHTSTTTHTGTSTATSTSYTSTSRIVRVTIACAIVVVVITGLVIGFRIAYLIRSHRESRRRQLLHGFIHDPSSSANPQGFTNAGTGVPSGYFLAQNTKKSWGGRAIRNAHKIEEWEGEAA